MTSRHTTIVRAAFAAALFGQLLSACNDTNANAIHRNALLASSPIIYSFSNCEAAQTALADGAFTPEFALACENSVSTDSGASLGCRLHKYTGSCVDRVNENAIDIGQRCQDIVQNIDDCDAGKIALRLGNGYSPVACRTAADGSSCEVAPVAIPEGKRCRVNTENPDLVVQFPAAACAQYDDSAYNTPYTCGDLVAEMPGNTYCVRPDIDDFIPQACLPAPNLGGDGGILDQMCNRRSEGTTQKVQKSASERVLVDGYPAHSCSVASTTVGKGELLTDIARICEMR